MNSDYHWSAVSPTATGRAAFLSMRLCGSPSADVLPPASAIATQAASGIAASVVQAAGQWPEGNTEGASAFQSGIRSQLNYCPGVGDVISVDLRPAPSWYGFAATLLVGKERDNPTSEVHIYNVVPRSRAPSRSWRSPCLAPVVSRRRGSRSTTQRCCAPWPSRCARVPASEGFPVTMRGWLRTISALVVIAGLGAAVPAAAEPKSLPDSVWINPETSLWTAPRTGLHCRAVRLPLIARHSGRPISASRWVRACRNHPNRLPRRSVPTNPDGRRSKWSRIGPGRPL